MLLLTSEKRLVALLMLLSDKGQLLSNGWNTVVIAHQVPGFFSASHARTTRYLVMLFTILTFHRCPVGRHSVLEVTLFVSSARIIDSQSFLFVRRRELVYLETNML